MTTYNQACIKLSIPPPLPGGGNKIKGFGDGKENKKLEKEEKIFFLKIWYFWQFQKVIFDHYSTI